MKLVSTNPAKNYSVLGEVEVSSKKEIKEKVNKANLVKEKWASIGLDKRLQLLSKILVEIKKRKEELSLLTSKEMGMPISQSRLDLDITVIPYFEWYLNNARKYLSPEITFEDNKSIHKVFYEPIGVAAVIVPWNFPVSNFIWGVIQNLIVGNVVVFKHSEESSLSGKLIEQIVQSANLPEGVFSEVYGDNTAGDFLIHQNIDLICFTGSTKVGKYLYRIASEKFIKVVLELGGSAPGIIFEDADVDSVLESIYVARFTNCGQACDGLKRLIVHKDKFNEVVKKLSDLLKKKQIGDPENESTDFGPLVAKRQLELLQQQLQDGLNKGARIIFGGKIPPNLKGAYFEPTLLTQIKPSMRVWKEEVFGPILPIIAFNNEDEAVSLANDTNYGLGSYIFTSDKKRALRVSSKIKAGMVSINNAYYVHPASPFGGYKKSGLGREHGKYGFHELCQIKVVSFEK